MPHTSLLLLTDSYWPARGGVEETIRALVANLQSNFQIRILTHAFRAPSRNAGLLARYALHNCDPYRDPSGCEVIPLAPTTIGRIRLLRLVLWNLPFIRRKNAAARYDSLYTAYRSAFFPVLRKYIRGSQVQLVHCFSTGYPARAAAALCAEQNVPLIHSPFIHFGRWGDSPEQIRAYALAAVVTCPTEAFRKRLVEHCDPALTLHTRVIAPVVPEISSLSQKRAAVASPFVLFLGRREAHKGLAMLLVAFRGLEHLASLVVAGPGDAIHLRNDYIFDLGEVEDDVRNWLLSKCEFLCVPSHDETFGLVYAEAMSKGKPIVALDVPPMREIVAHDESGILVCPDDTDGLRMALGRLLLDEHLRKRMGKAALERYRKLFSVEVITAQIVELYESVLKKNVTIHAP